MAAIRIRSMYRRRISGLMNALLDRFWDGWDGPTRVRPGALPGRAHFEPLEPKVLLSADLLPGTPLSFTDADGTLVTVTLSGSGSGVLDDTGGNASLTLQGNDLTTRVVIGAQGGDGRFQLSGLSASGRNLGAIVAPNADLTGVIRLDGHLGELSLRAAQGASTVHAASVGTLSVAADFTAGFELTGPDAGLALTRATIGGVLSGAWNVQGRSGSLKAGEVDAAWTGAFGDPLTSLTTVGDFHGTAYLPSLLQLTVGGALSGATLVVGADLGSDGALGGAGTRADSFSTGNLSRVRVNGAVVDSTIRVGVDPVNGVFDDGNDAVLPGGRIQEFLVGGALTGSSIIAATLPQQVRVQGSLVSTATLSAFRTAALDKAAPSLVASLASDTGASSTDRLTADPTVSGRVTDLGAVTGLTLSFQGRDVDVSQALNTDGTFLLTRGAIEAALGTTLTDGAIALGLRARDAGGNFSNAVTVAFELDTAAPDLLSFGVVSADAVGGDSAKAAAATVVLRGEGTAGATVSYAGQNVLVGSGGVFALPGVGLVLGDNAITLTIRDLAGNTDSLTRTITRVARTQADPILVWNDIALRAVQLDVSDPPVATRALAMVSLAQYDALAAIEGTAAYLVQRTVSGPVSAAAATAAAAHRVLSRIYPAQQAVFDDALSNDLAAIDDGAAKDSGIALGLAIADAILALRANDGSEDFVSYDGSTELGKWRPTGPAFDVADVPHWASVEPFALSSPGQFRPVAPPALDSAAYAAAVEEVKRLGSATSTQRTADQTQIALFWADGKGSFTPPGHWNQIASEVARSRGSSLTDNARLFAQLNVALADTAIACWDAKYTYGLWRPETAIQNADLDGNAGTTVDAAWRPLLLTPPHPEYVSGHSSFSRAAATVLASHFGDDTTFSTTSATLPGVTRTFSSFTEAAGEAGRSRIYGGIHYEFTNQAGQVLGAQVANAVLARFALSGDSQAPAIPLGDTPAVTNTNVTLRGQVLDNLSGVASAEFRIDGGALQTLSLDANGGFTITTALPTDGSADGAHTITIVARDAAGNANAGVTRGFTLDTRAPTITLPSLPDGAALGATSRLTGTADPTGTTLTQLSYRIDGGVSRTLAFDAATGAFDESLPFGNLDVGDHTLVLTARDAGGNLATLTRTVKVEALAPLTVTSLTPTEGSGDVGVTVRPQVRFSRAVNLSTLTADSFFATGPDGSKLDATVVPASDGTYAWLFFTNPMPGGSRVTLHVDGSKIRGAADGTFLDADGNGTAGGTLTQSFTTVSRTAVAGTKLVGKVVDPGADLEPMTFDDIRRGPDGVIHTADDVFLLPIAHAKVFILGQEDRFVFTDAAGNFELTDVPAGTVKVAIDGRTATNAPSGVFFPEMVMDVELRPGVVNTVMSGMGSDAERAANLDRREVYLPRIPTSSLQEVSDTATTVITVSDAKSAPQLSEQERAALTLTVQPGSAIGENGKALDNVQIGISTVPPELVRDMLPPGVLQHTFDITIQAPGVATFAEPLQITFPNVFNAAPGTKLNILSFDHTTGRLVINGTGTVSADGLTVVSDPDSGIRAPGWHSMTPPGSPGGGTPPPPIPCDPPGGPIQPTESFLTLGMITGGETASTLLDLAANLPSPGPGEQVNVDIKLDGVAAKFLKINGSTSFARNGSTPSGTIVSELKTRAYSELPGGLNSFNEPTVFGGVVTVTVTRSAADPSHSDCPVKSAVEVRKYIVYRYIDSRSGETPTVYEFNDALVNTNPKAEPFKQAFKFEFSTEAEGTVTLASESGAAGPKPFTLARSGGSATVTFSPPAVQSFGDEIRIQPQKDPTRVVAGPSLNGKGTEAQVISLNRAELIAELTQAVESDMPFYWLSGLLTSQLTTDGVADPDKIGQLADLAIGYAVSYFNPVGSAVKFSLGNAGGLVMDYSPGVDPGASLLLGTVGIVYGKAVEGIDNVDAAYGVLKQQGTRSSDWMRYHFVEAFNTTRENRVEVYVRNLFAVPLVEQTVTLNGFANKIGYVIAHEAGHALGLHHAFSQSGAIDSSDVMSYEDPAGLAFRASLPSLELGLDLAPAARLQGASNYLVQWINGGPAAIGGGSGRDPDTDLPLIGPFAPILAIGTPDNIVLSDVDLGVLTVGSATPTKLFVRNLGSDPLTVRSLVVAGETVGGTLSADPIAPGDTRELSVDLTSLAPGRYNDAIRIEYGNGSTQTIAFRFSVQSAAPAAVTALSNNLGATSLGSSSEGAVVSVTNEGAQTLTITSAALLSGEESFRIVDFTPQSLGYGESGEIKVRFAPTTFGLTRGLIELTTNDPARPKIVLSVVGTGVSDERQYQWGGDAIAVTTGTGDGANTLRTMSDAAGRFEIFLSASTAYEVGVFDFESQLLAVGGGVTAPPGSPTNLTAGLAFGASTAVDSDFDGLPDDIEQTIGTNAGRKDTDNDGIDDFIEVKQGLDPSGGRNVPVGIVAATPLAGSAEAVDVVASAAGGPAVAAVVATGNGGLAIVDVSAFDSPALLSQIDLAGFNVGVAMDATRGVAAVAGSGAGLHLVNVSNLASPALIQTVDLGASVTAVALGDGIAYAASGRRVVGVDLNTGETRSSVDFGLVGGAALVSLVRDGNTLFTLDADNTLRAIDIAGDVLTPRGSIALAVGGGKLFVGGGTAYVGREDRFNGGFSTVDVRDLGNLRLLSGPDANNVAGDAIVANGSGLAVTVGQIGGAFGANALDVLNVADPTNTGVVVTRVNLPAAPRGVALANGMAFVAAGEAGLQIVNFIGFDTQGTEPAVSIQADAIDVDAAAAGTQVLEGRSVRVVPTVTDDVQVRNIELLVNGVVVATDVAFPWELFAQVPTVAAGGSTMTIQVRATDTGGNVGLSNIVTLDVTPDTFPPKVTSASVADGERLFFVRSIDIAFDEPIDTALLAVGGMHLVRAGADGAFDTADDVPQTVRFDTRSFGQSLSVLVDDVLAPGAYRLTIDADIVADIAGNTIAAPIVRTFSVRPASDVRAVSGAPEIPTAPAANPGQQIAVAVPFDPATARAQFSVIDVAGNRTTRVVTPARADPIAGVAYFTVPLDAVTGETVVFSLVGGVRTDFPDGTFPLQILPVITDVQVQSVSSDATTATVLISGLGFVEGGVSEYRFGTTIVPDPGVSAGPDVQSRFDAVLGFVPNAAVSVVVPLIGGSFGSISVKTGGGTSAQYSVSVDAIEAVALSGTPADAGQASANAGQAVELRGSGLSVGTDVLLRWVDNSGVQQVTVLSPVAASADGTRATLVLPLYANGAFGLQVFGSGSQPMLQVVPKLTGVEADGRTLLLGSGFVEGATVYGFPGTAVADTAGDGGEVDVGFTRDFSAQNGSASLGATALPRYGYGSVTVSTAGGTSAALGLEALRTSVTGVSLGDVAADAQGQLWVSDQANPGHLLKVDAGTGQTLQTITMSAAYGTQFTQSYTGLQVLRGTMRLGSTDVGPGNLLVFNGAPNTDRVVAVNQISGVVLASLALAQNYDLTGAAYDEVGNRIYVAAERGNAIVVVNAQTGAEVERIAAPFSVAGNSGLAIDAGARRLWVGSTSGGAQLVEYAIGAGGGLTELRRIDTRPQGVDSGEITGLSVGPDGRLYVATTQGVVHRIDTTLDASAVKPATLTGVIGTAGGGVAADATKASANVGEVIELTGSNFGAGTRVLFETRDASGSTGLFSAAPLAIDESGTRLQVRVPDQATTGLVRVVNQSTGNLGFSGSEDAIYRDVTVSFTAGADTATVRFADGGLQGLFDESWGIDNVEVRQGATLVFADDFESGSAAAGWGSRVVNAEERAAFSRFSGRFSSTSQALSLSGLTAGQTYTLKFDLYVLDSWDGSAPSVGPDQFEVSVDGAVLLRESFANRTGTASAQSFGASAGVALQIVPTLTAMSGRPGGDGTFTLSGSGFMEGASTVSVGGMAFVDTAANAGQFLDVSGTRNDTLSLVAPRTLDGPIRVTTAGGYAELAGPVFAPQPPSLFTGIVASAAAGVAADATKASAVTGQLIVLQGQGFTGSTLVQFQGIDDSGRVGTITTTGTAGAGGTTLSVAVPALARTGLVTVLGSGTGIGLQVVPTLRALGGTVAAGNTLVLEGSGLTADDLIVSVGGRAAGTFEVRTLIDGTGSSPDQQLLRVTVPAGVSGSVVTVSTAGGSFTLNPGLAISAAALSGTAAQAGVAAANTGQTITLTGAFAPGDQVVFTTMDTTGNLTTRTVAPANLDVAGGTLQVVVPADAVTGQVRLARSATGALLQVVPTVSDVSMNAGGVFTGGILTIGGSGFAEGTTAVLMGEVRLEDTSRTTGINVSGSTSLSLSVPGAVSAGPILVSTAGGTSAPLGLTVNRIVASAGSGTAADAGQASANPGQTITVEGVGLDTGTDVVFRVIEQFGGVSDVVVKPSVVNTAGTQAQVLVPLNAISGVVRVVGERNGTEPFLQILPVIRDVQVQSVSSDATTATVLISGLGFVEGGVSEYRFGTTIVPDPGVSAGPDVQSRFDAVLGFVPNAAVSVVVPLIGGSFGSISVKTGGGTSAQYSVSVDAIEAVALSGTPADAGQASANAGQAVELRGSGLSVGTDVLLRWVDNSGVQQVTVLSPVAASADGTRATLVLPLYANGAFGLQVFGSGSQPMLQVVPKLTGVEADGRTLLLGSGFVEGATVYGFPGTAVADTAGDGGEVDVGFTRDFSAQNGSASLGATALPRYGYGSVTVSTAGGTSAALGLEALRTSVTGVSLGDVAADAQGQLWVSDQANPGHLLKVDAGTGQTLQTITMSAAYGTQFTQSYTGLQVLRGTMRLGSTDVGPGNLLVFNGAPNTDRVVAVNQISGVVLASLALAQNYDLTGAAYDEVGNRIYVAAERGNAIVVVNAQTGAEVERIAAPFSVAGNSGLAIDAGARRLWVGSTSGGAQLVEYAIGAGGGLTELRRIDTRPQGVDSGEITGLSVGPDGRLYVATTQGVVHRITISPPPAPPAPVLSPEILASLSTQAFAAVAPSTADATVAGIAARSAAPAPSVARVVDEMPMIRLPGTATSAERVEARKPSAGSLASVAQEGGLVQWKKPLREALKAFRMGAMARK